MNRRSWLLAPVLLAIVGVLFGWSLLSAQGAKSPRAIPEGFRWEYVFIEKEDGRFALLRNPEIRSLAGKLYLVGQTTSIPDVTDDELFALTTQWINLERVRRMGEMRQESVIHDIRNIALRMKRESASK